MLRNILIQCLTSIVWKCKEIKCLGQDHGQNPDRPRKKVF